MIKKPKIAYIKWFDSYSSGNTVLTQEEIDEEERFVVEDTGFLISDSGEYIRYASSRYEDGRWKHVHAIPKCNIIKKKIYRVT